MNIRIPRRLFALPLALLFTVSANADLEASLREDGGVPAILYHYGTYEVLMKNVEADTVPEEDWNTYILGDRTRYGQKWYRRGLYGSAHPAYAAYFSDISTGKGKQPWLMGIALTNSCRNEMPYDLTTLYRDPRMVEFIKSAGDPLFLTPKVFLEKCYMRDPTTDTVWPNFEVIQGDDPITHCESFLNEAFEALKPRIVVDSAWSSSWYIRDRSCLKEIHGSAREVLKMMTRLPGFWSKNTPDGELRTGNMMENASAFPLLLKTLLTHPRPSRTQLLMLAKKLAASDIRNPGGWRPEALKPRWLSDSGTRLISNWIECQEKRQLEPLRNKLAPMLDELNQRSTPEPFEAQVDLILEKSAC